MWPQRCCVGKARLHILFSCVLTSAGLLNHSECACSAVQQRFIKHLLHSVPDTLCFIPIISLNPRNSIIQQVPSAACWQYEKTMAQKVQSSQDQKALCAKIPPLFLSVATLDTPLWTFLFWSHTQSPWGRKVVLMIPGEPEIWEILTLEGIRRVLLSLLTYFLSWRSNRPQCWAAKTLKPASWAWIPARIITSYATWGRLLNLSVLCFTYF